MSKNPTQFDPVSQRRYVAPLFGVLLVFVLISATTYAILAETHLTASITTNSTQVTPTTASLTGQESTAPEASPLSSTAPAEVVSAGVVERPVGHFGIAVGQTLSGLSKAALEAELDDLVGLGVGWIRFDIDWSEIQPYDSDHYNWRNIDRIVAAAEARDMQLVATLSYTPQWARMEYCTSSKCAPADPWQFARFAKEAVHRYAPQGVQYWEIWNEPNLVSFWKPEPDVGDYTLLLQVSYNAIKSEDEKAIVISGGLGPIATENGNIAPLTFVRELYDQEGGEYFDALGFHPYTFPVPPSYTKVWSAWSQMSATNPSLRSIMTAHGDAEKKIWLTEFGAPTGGPGTLATLSNYTRVQQPSYVTEELQAHMLTEALILAEEYEWAGPLFWYSYKDLGTSTDTIENFFGLLRFDGSKKPAYIALQEIFNAQ